MKTVKTLIKIFLIAMIGIMLIISLGSTRVYASEESGESKVSGDQLSIDSIFKKGSSFIDTGANGNKMEEDQIESLFMPVGQILVIVANAVIIIVVAIMGIQWIISGPEKQAKLKQQLIGLVVSIVVIYGAVGIWTLIKNFMEGLGI